MAIIFTARLRVRNWRALLRLSDEALLLYARATGAWRYQLCRDGHDAAEALLLVEADSMEALRPLYDALLRLDDPAHGQTPISERPGLIAFRFWEPTGCRTLVAAASMEAPFATTKELRMTEHVSLLLRSLEAWNRHDLAAYGELYAPEAVIHGVAPAPLGVAETLAVYMAFFTGFPDLRLTVEETLSEGERIAVRFTITGTHQGEFQGLAPTGRPIAVQGISTLHFRDGRVVSRWNQLDQLGMLQQLGALPAPVRA